MVLEARVQLRMRSRQLVERERWPYGVIRTTWNLHPTRLGALQKKYHAYEPFLTQQNHRNPWELQPQTKQAFPSCFILGNRSRPRTPQMQKCTFRTESYAILLSLAIIRCFFALYIPAGRAWSAVEKTTLWTKQKPWLSGYAFAKKSLSCSW